MEKPRQFKKINQNFTEVGILKAIQKDDCSSLSNYVNKTTLSISEKAQILYIACLYRREKMVKFLLELGVTPNIPYEKHDIDEKHHLWQRYSNYWADYQCCHIHVTDYPLILACEQRDDKMVSLLLYHGANPNVERLIYVEPSGLRMTGDMPEQHIYDSVLKVTIKANDINILKKIIEAGVNVNPPYRYTDHPLEIAYKTNNIGIINLLKKAGSILNFEEILMQAAQRGDDREISFLLEHGVNPNYKNSNGVTALMLAAKGGNTLAVETLITAGANINARDFAGNTVLEYAQESFMGEYNIVPLLKSLGAKK